MKREVKLGIIGVGNMGSSHARGILAGKVKGCRLAAVCDINPERLKGYDEDVACFDNSKDLLASNSVDAVIIATPHYAHTTEGIAAIKAGLHVLVEKPISVHKADCQRLIAAHKGRRKVFAAMFNQRTDPKYQKVKELIEGGELGELRRVNWIITDWFRSQRYYDSGGWRATWSGEGGGVLVNQCPHQLDLMQWLFGMPCRVHANAGFGKYHDIEVEDEVTALLEYPNGATGVFITSTGEAPGTNRLEVVGTRGKVVVEGGEIKFTRNEQPSDEFCATSQASFAKPKVWNIEIPTRGGGGQHMEVLQNYVDAIREKKPLIAPAKDGIRSVELANAMQLSALTGKTVDVPLNAVGFERRLKKLISESKFTKKSVKDAGVADLSGSF